MWLVVSSSLLVAAVVIAQDGNTTAPVSEMPVSHFVLEEPKL